MAKKTVKLQEEPIEDSVPVEGAVEITLSEDPAGGTEVELAPKPPPSPDPEPAPINEPPVDDNPLQKALDAQKRAEALAAQNQRERDEAVRQTRERDAELVQERTAHEDAQYNSVLTAIAAEQSALDKAEADYAAAASAGDWATAGKAQSIMARAASRIDRLEDGKQAFDQRREQVKTAPPPQRTAAPLDFEQQIAQLPDSAKSWLRQHPEFIRDTKLNSQISAAHDYLTKRKGVDAFSEAYFDALDTEFGFKAPPAPPPEPEPQPQRRSMPVSAPVSRDVPTASGQRQPSTKITLTEEERRIARTAYTATDMTDAQKEYAYAKNKQKLMNMRANGQYRQTTEQTG